MAAAADCIDDAARYHGTNADVLRGIAIVESRVRPDAVNVNSNGTVDRGMYQINSIHLRTFSAWGIKEADLHDPCRSSYLAAAILKERMNKYGNTWAAVGAYHSYTPSKRDAYAAKVREVVNFIVSRRVASNF